MNTRTQNVDFSEWERNTAFTAEQLLALYESDPIVEFAIDGMIGDATEKWLKDFEEPDPEHPIAPKIRTAMCWSDLYGDAIAVMLEQVEKDSDTYDPATLAKPFSGKAVGMDVFHPLVDDDGYDDPGTEALGPLGDPKYFKVHIKGVKGTIQIDASRCIIFTGRKTRRTWRGMCIFAGCLDDIIDYRKWRAAYGQRASTVAVPSFTANKPEGGKWSDPEKTILNAVFGQDKVATTVGVEFGTLGGALVAGEIDSVREALLEAIASDLGITKNDLKGAEAGQKLSTDSNQSTYVIALKSIQKRHEIPVSRVLKAFGIKFNGWNSPWEEALQVQITNFQNLASTYDMNRDPEIKAIAKSMIVDIYGEKTDYGKYVNAERANAEREAKRLDLESRNNNFSSRTSNSGETGTD